MATYVNNLRLKEITTGDEDGTWGTSTNTNLELIGEALGYNTQDCFASDANATTTVADGATDPARAFYFKVTSSATLTATRTLTIAPNTVSRVMFIENATTGSQSIEVSQGSGANVTIPTGETKIVYLDGAGATAAVVDALSLVDVGDGTVTSVGGTGTVNGLTLTGTVTSSGNLTLGGTLANVDLTSQVTGTLPIANGGTGSTSTTYVDLTANVTGTLPETNGGTNQSTYTQGDILYSDSSNSLARLALGTANQVLQVNSGATQIEWADSGGGADIQEFTSSGTWTKPAGAKFVRVDVFGAGGGGGGGAAQPSINQGLSGGAGGGGGSYNSFVFDAADLGATETVTIGAGGAGGAGGNGIPAVGESPGSAGTAGGDSSFGSHIKAWGGGGGAGGRRDTSNVATGGIGAAVFSRSPSSSYASPAGAILGFMGGYRPSSAGNGGGSGYGGGSGASINAEGTYTGGGSAYGGGGGGSGGGYQHSPATFFSGSAGGGDFNSNITQFTGGGGSGGGNNTAGTPGGTGRKGGGGGGPRTSPGVAGLAGGDGGAIGGAGGGGGIAFNAQAGSGGDGGNGYIAVYTWS